MVPALILLFFLLLLVAAVILGTLFSRIHHLSEALRRLERATSSLHARLSDIES